MTRATDRNADIHAVVSDDALLDRLGSGLDIFDDVPVEAILQQWRAGCLLPELPAVPQGRAVRRAAKWLEPDSRRSRRHRSWQAATGIAASIALLLGATTAIGARTAHPGDALWPVTELLWSDRADSVKAQQSAQQSLGEAREALAAGDLPRVRVALSSAATVLPKIESQDGHDSVQANLNAMALRLGALAPASSTAAGSSSPSIDQQDAGPATDRSIPSDNGANVAVAPSHPSVSQSAPASAATRAPAQLAPGSAAPTSPATGKVPVAPSPSSVAPSSAAPSSAAPSSTPSTLASSTSPSAMSPSASTTAPTTSGSPTSTSPTAASSTAPATTTQPTDPSPAVPSIPEPSQPVPSVDVGAPSRSILPLPPSFGTETAVPTTDATITDTARTDTSAGRGAVTRHGLSTTRGLSTTPTDLASADPAPSDTPSSDTPSTGTPSSDTAADSTQVEPSATSTADSSSVSVPA